LITRSAKVNKSPGNIDFLRRLEVYRQLELHRLLDREVDRMGAFENVVDIVGRPTE
jgi:hypothetical protein